MTNKLALLLVLIVMPSLATAAGFQAGAGASVQKVPTPTVPSDAFQVHYVSNLTIGDSFVNVTNAGTQGGFDPAGRICTNVYVFDPLEEMIACCSCRVTPNGLNSLSVKNDLTTNTLTSAVQTAVVIKLLATTPNAGSCDASLPSGAKLAPGMRAWGTTIHALPTSPVTYGVTETEFSPAVLSLSELAKLSSQCGFIETTASGFGICSCGSQGGL